MSTIIYNNTIEIKNTLGDIILSTNERLLAITSAGNLTDTIPSIPANSGYFSNDRFVQNIDYSCNFFRTPAPSLFFGGFYNPGFDVMVLGALSYTYYYVDGNTIRANTTGFHQTSLMSALTGGVYNSFFWAGNYDL